MYAIFLLVIIFALSAIDVQLKEQRKHISNVSACHFHGMYLPAYWNVVWDFLHF